MTADQAAAYTRGREVRRMLGMLPPGRCAARPTAEMGRMLRLAGDALDLAGKLPPGTPIPAEMRDAVTAAGRFLVAAEPIAREAELRNLDRFATRGVVQLAAKHGVPPDDVFPEGCEPDDLFVARGFLDMDAELGRAA